MLVLQLLHRSEVSPEAKLVVFSTLLAIQHLHRRADGERTPYNIFLSLSSPFFLVYYVKTSQQQIKQRQQEEEEEEAPRYNLCFCCRLFNMEGVYLTAGFPDTVWQASICQQDIAQTQTQPRLTVSSVLPLTPTEQPNTLCNSQLILCCVCEARSAFVAVI